MNTHVTSKLIFKRIGNGNTIGYYDVTNGENSSFSINASNPNITIKDLHDNVSFSPIFNLDLESKRLKLENKYAIAIDKIINCKTNDPCLTEKQIWDIVIYFVLQAFITVSNIENNKKIFNDYLKTLVKNPNKKFQKRITVQDISKEIVNKKIPVGEILINNKFKELLENKGPYYRKAELTKLLFKPEL